MIFSGQVVLVKVHQAILRRVCNNKRSGAKLCLSLCHCPRLWTVTVGKIRFILLNNNHRMDWSPLLPISKATANLLFNVFSSIPFCQVYICISHHLVCEIDHRLSCICSVNHYVFIWFWCMYVFCLWLAGYIILSYRTNIWLSKSKNFDSKDPLKHLFDSLLKHATKNAFQHRSLWILLVK